MVNFRITCNLALSMALHRFPSATHERAWKKFEPKVFYTRTMMFLTARILQSTLFLIIGAETYQLSEKYSTKKVEEQNVDESSASKILPWTSIFLQILMVLRFIMFLLAFRYSCATKATFYLEVIVQMIESVLPLDFASASCLLTAKMMASFIIFTTTYYSFWLNYLCSLVAN